jgi:hypothetical protein
MSVTSSFLQQSNKIGSKMRIAAVMAAAVAAGAGAVRAGTGQVGTVFYIELENHNFTQPNGNVDNSSTSIEQLKGNSAAPFLNSLVTPGNPNAAQSSYASAYHNVLATASGLNPSIHPSEPNYIWQEGGSNFGVLNDADPYKETAGNPNNISSASNLSGLLQASGKTWKSYSEDTQLSAGNTPAANSLGSTALPQSQWTVPLSSFSGTSPSYVNPYNGSNQYNFAPKHTGQLFFTSTNGGTTTTPNTGTVSTNPEAAFYPPLQQLSTDLANNTVAQYNVITPNQFNDMHSALNTNFTYNGVTYKAGTDAEQIALGDNFLSKIVPMIEASAAYKNNGAIVIWNDEVEAQNATDTTANDFSHTSTEIVLSPLAKGNAFDSTVNYTHSSDLKTLEELFGLSPLLQDAASPGVNDLSNMFVSGAITGTTAVPLPPAVWTGAGLMGILGLVMLRRRAVAA